MRKLALLLLLALIPTQAWALNTDELLATIAMPLAVAAVSNVNGVQATRLTDFVTALNQGNVAPTQFVEVVRYVPVALVTPVNGQTDLVQFVQTDVSQGITGNALVDAIVNNLQTNFGVTPVMTLTQPATTLVVSDNFIPQLVLTQMTTLVPVTDALSLIGLPLAVSAVSNIAGIPQDQLALLVTAFNAANMPPVQEIQVLQFVPAALVVDNGQPFVQFVQQQVASGVIGPALVPVVTEQLQTFFPAQTITVSAPATLAVAPQAVFVDPQNFVPPVVINRVTELRANPHGGPPGQIKKQLGLQTGAEVVHGGVKPGRQFGTAPTVVSPVPPVAVVPRHEGRGRGRAERVEPMPKPMTSASPPAVKPAKPEHGRGRGHVEAAPPAAVPQAVPAAPQAQAPAMAPPAAPPGKAANPEGKGPPPGKGGGKGHGKD